MNEQSYKQRRDALLTRMGEGVGVIASARFQIRSNDTEYPYRQSSNFHYLTGFSEDEAALVLVKTSQEQKVLLFVHAKNEEVELWSGERTGVDRAKNRFDVDEVHAIDTFETVLKEQLKNREHLYLELFEEDALYIKARRVCKELLHDRSCKKLPRHHIDIAFMVQTMRLIKSDEEVACIKKALEITKKAHHRAMALAAPQMPEYRLQADIEYTFKRGGAYSDAYTTIVAGANNANTLHYISNRDALLDNTLVLIDAGCEYAMYASDITRTFPVNGRFTEPQRQLYEMILDVQLRVIDMIRPGVTKTELQNSAELWLTEGLIDLGILSGSAEILIEAKAHKKYFPHGIGHWMGMDVHDPCPYADDAGEDILFASGMVLTIEPGIYIREEDEAVPEKYRGIGIRIEDNILITQEGHENLSEGIAKTVDEIEAVCAGDMVITPGS